MPKSRSRSNHPSEDQNSTPTASSFVTSASVLSKQAFSTWATAVGLNTGIRSSIPSSEGFRHLRNLKDLSDRFPAWLADASSPQSQYLSIPLALQKGANNLYADLTWRKLANPTSFCEDVELDSFSLLVILSACNHMRLLDTDIRKPTEADRRISLDILLSHVCEIDSSTASVKYSTEQELKLPEVPFLNYNVSQTKADGVMHVRIPDYVPNMVKKMGIASTAFCHDTKDGVLELVHCAAEFKREGDGSNQAMMAMVSGLYQKRVLQVPGQFVFGVLHSNKIHVQVVAGIWEENNIQLYEIGDYSLMVPTQALQFYLVLRGIHRCASSYLRELQDSAQSLASRVMANPPPTTWYPPRMGPIPENPNESGQQPPQQGGANTQQGTSRQRHAYRKVQSYLKSTSSLDEYLPVDLPPTLPIDLPACSTVDSAKSPLMTPDLGDGSDSSSDESDTPHNLPLYVPVSSQDHKAHLTVDPLGLMGRIQNEDL